MWDTVPWKTSLLKACYLGTDIPVRSYLPLFPEYFLTNADSHILQLVIVLLGMLKLN